PAGVLGSSLGTLSASAGRLVEGGAADVCIFKADAWWTPRGEQLSSQGKHSPFLGHELPATVTHTLVGGQLVFERAAVPTGAVC
ncbi:MAG TPA: dihydroorotase, partial [Burkholderiaceae bacterium]|nr:dihydroorotase [Burkholderiaceae bacterium]